MEAFKKIDYILYDGTNKDKVQDFLVTYYRPKSYKSLSELEREVSIPEWLNNKVTVKVLKIDTDLNTLYVAQGVYITINSSDKTKLSIMTKEEFDKEYTTPPTDVTPIPFYPNCSSCPWYLNGFRDIKWPTPGDGPFNPMTVTCKAEDNNESNGFI